MHLFKRDEKGWWRIPFKFADCVFASHAMRAVHLELAAGVITIDKVEHGVQVKTQASICNFIDKKDLQWYKSEFTSGIVLNMTL